MGKKKEQKRIVKEIHRDNYLSFLMSLDKSNLVKLNMLTGDMALMAYENVSGTSIPKKHHNLYKLDMAETLIEKILELDGEGWMDMRLAKK